MPNLLMRARDILFGDRAPHLRDLVPLVRHMTPGQMRRAMALVGAAAGAVERVQVVRRVLQLLPADDRQELLRVAVASLRAGVIPDSHDALVTLSDVVTPVEIRALTQAIAVESWDLQAKGVAAGTLALRAAKLEVIERIVASTGGWSAEWIAAAGATLAPALGDPRWDDASSLVRTYLHKRTFELPTHFGRLTVLALDEKWSSERAEALNAIEANPRVVPSASITRIEPVWFRGGGLDASGGSYQALDTLLTHQASDGQRTALVDNLMWEIAQAHGHERTAPRAAPVAHDLGATRRDEKPLRPGAPRSPAPPSPPREGHSAPLYRQARAPVEEQLHSENAFPSPPRSEPQTSRKVYARIDCAEEVAVAAVFEVVIGIHDGPQRGVSGGPMTIPDTTEIDVILDTRGLVLVFGARRFKLHVAGGNLPAVSLGLRAPEAPATIELRAFYSVAGVQIGTGTRAIAVVGADPSTRVAPAQSEAVGLTPRPDLAVDILVRIIRRPGAYPAVLEWTFDSSHPEIKTATPHQVLETELPQDPQDLAEGTIRAIERLEGTAAVVDTLLGEGRVIARLMPSELFELVRCARAILGRAPTLLFLTDDVQVPWELATIPDECADATLPQHLCVQARVGKWLLTDYQGAEHQFPPVVLKVTTVDVLWSKYGGTTGEDSLPHAEGEASYLSKRFRARSCDATADVLTKRIRATPVADLLHFAMHGDYSTQGRQGLVTADKRILGPNFFRARRLNGTPFVFLNACRVAATTMRLGVHAGVAPALVAAGAGAVLAPLWSVNDRRAKAFAIEFYDRVCRCEVVQEFLANNMMSLGGPADPNTVFSVAYQFYGHPSLRVVFEGG